MRANFEKTEQLTNYIIDKLENEHDILIEVKAQQAYLGVISRADTFALTTKECGTKNDTHTRLPKLELPHCSGNHLEWQSFYELFCCSVAENNRLSVIEKFS